jgi:hypothetical protein
VTACRRPYNPRVAKPSKVGAIFLFLFGMPFLGFGLVAAYSFLFSSPSTHTSGNPIFGVLFGLVFAGIGGGLMFGAVYGYGKQKEDQATKEANPDSPWLWRKDWAANRAESLKRSTIYGWWIGAGLVSMIVVPILANVLPQLLRDSNPIALVLMGIALIPTLLLIGAVRATIRRERYGKTYFEFGSLPFLPGSHLRGQIQLRLNTAADHGIGLRLSCIRRIVTQSGKDRTTNDAVLWKDEKNVPQSYLAVGPLGTAIPVDFAIPQDGYETNHEQSDDQLLWVLHAQADVPGVDYSDDFEVPVFATTSARAAAASSSTGSEVFGNFAGTAIAEADADRTAPAFRSDSSDVPAPAHPRVVLSTTAEGNTEFYFPPFRNKGQALVLFLFTAVWTVIVYFLWNSRAPWFFPVVFGFFDLTLIYGCIQSAFGSTRITVGNGKVVSLRKIFGPGKPREFPFADTQAVLVAAGMQQGKTASCLVRLKTKSGKDFTLADNIADRQEARWIVAQIEKLAGLKLDTHVELADSFGRPMGPPPQRIG